MSLLPADPNASFIQMSLGRGGFSLRKLLVATTLGVLTVALIISAIVIAPQLASMNRAGQTNVRNTGPAQSTTVTSASTPTATGSLAAQWQHNPSFDTIFSIAVAPSQPGNAYACYQVLANGAGVIGMLALHNGGAQWALLTKDIAPGYGCQVSVDPTDARDVAVTIDPCPQNSCVGPPQTFNTLYRSHDGGVSWHAMRLPDANPIIGFGPDMAWSGANLLDATLAVGTQVTAQHPLHQLALSVRGAPFVWADHNGSLTGNDSGRIALIGGLPGVLYAGLLPGQPGARACFDPPYINLVASHDNGQTWRPLSLSNGFGNPITYVQTAPDGQRLIAYDAVGSHYAISSDEGKTWVELPATGPVGPCGLWVAPDGTTVANLVRIQSGTITGDPLPGLALCALKGQSLQSLPHSQDAPAFPASTLGCHGQSWQTLPNSQDDRVTPFAVTYDAHGHPSRVWAFFRPNQSTVEVVEYLVN